MKVDAFDFELPEELIALRPAVPRDAARMLRVRADPAAPTGKPDLADALVRELPSHLSPGDVLVFNDTRVLNAQLTGLRSPRPGEDSAGAVGHQPSLNAPRIDFTLHKRLGPNVWRAFARPGKKLQIGDRLTLGGTLGAQVKDKSEEGDVVLAFEEEGPALDQAIARIGVTPLPPYIARRRAVDGRDKEDYQTVYAVHEGSVAAPTAGLHFTDELLAALDQAGIHQARVTLHVGAGTFLPVKAEDTADHRMHSEWGRVSPETVDLINGARAEGKRVICVGTTSLRLIESAADEDGTLHLFEDETDIFITPGYKFRAAGGLLTNFHLPRSTLFMLVSAFCGLEAMQAAYAHAIAERYRFYSYGDCTLLLRGTP